MHDRVSSLLLILLSSVALTAGSTPQTPTAPPPAVEVKAHELAYVAVNIPESQARVSEKSLIWVGQRVLRKDEGAPREMGTGLYDIPPFEDLIEDERQAVRVYRFVLKPKERLKVALTAADDGLITMKFVRIVRTDPLTRQVRTANFPTEQLRRKRIQIENPYDAPNECFLQLLGKRNFPYTMNIERVPVR